MKGTKSLLISVGAVVLALFVFAGLYWSAMRQRGISLESVEPPLEMMTTVAEPETEEKPIELLIYRLTSRRPGRPSELKVEIELATSPDPATRALQIVNAAIQELHSMVPVGAVQQVYLLENGTAIVDFSEDVVSNIRGGASAEYAVLLTLTRSLKNNLEGIEQVRFLVGGLEQPTLSGHISLATPFR